MSSYKAIKFLTIQGRKGGRRLKKREGFGGEYKEVGPQQKWQSYCVTAYARSFRGMLSLKFTLKSC